MDNVRLVDKRMLVMFRRIKDHYESMLREGYAPSNIRYLLVGKCFHCEKSFKINDKIIRINNGKWVHQDCYKLMAYDIPDSILDEEDWKIIEGDD